MTDSNIPAGWYEDGQTPDVIRYWDGAAWTDQTAARPVAASFPPPAPGTAPAPEPVAPAYASYAPPPPAAGPATAPPPRPARKASPKGWIIAASIVGGIILISGISTAVGNAQRTSSNALVPEVVETSEVPAPVITPSEEVVAEPAVEAPVVPVTTPAEFAIDAHKHLADISKDLDDIDLTIAEEGYFRLLSNTVELSFNEAQLAALDAPESVSVEWTTQLVALSTSISAMSDAVSTDGYDDDIATVATIRAQVAILDEIASRIG